MCRTSRWLALPLLLLALFVAAPSHAMPAAPSAAEFLAELSAPPCLAGAQTDFSELPSLVPERRVIYPDCGVACSDTRCSGQRTGSACTLAGGVPGFCKAANQVCLNEPARSPCTCTAI
ncbi:MAG TPA: hypothetical protein VJ885_13110 [Thermoanaerobaculia bacterium]|nr:hypothetical protein [Thermoanaerobaculia bacterium]